MPRGGRRSGSPGQSYSNRTDLNAAKPLAPTAAPGQQYGQGAAQLAAQRSVPMGPPPVLSAGGVTQGPGGGPSSAPLPGPLPGSMGAFNRGTERPAEPVTAGLASGPGPGPDSVPGLAGGMPDRTVGDLFNRLAAQPGASANVKAMASMLAQGRS